MLYSLLVVLQVTGTSALGVLLNSTIGKGAITCGDGKGNTCGNNWNNAYCSSNEGVKGSDAKGACCHDSFNVWCCPEGYHCSGVFNDPGGNDHCMTIDKHSSSCVCDTSAEAKVVKISAVGAPEVEYSEIDLLDQCCFNPDACEFQVTHKFSDTTEVSWQTTTKFGAKVSIAEGCLFEKVKFDFDWSTGITNGKTVSSGREVDINDQCSCSKETCNFKHIHLMYSLQVTKSTQPVKITNEVCGIQSETHGAVAMTTYNFKGDCARWKCKSDDQCRHDQNTDQSNYQCQVPEAIASVENFEQPTVDQLLTVD